MKLIFLDIDGVLNSWEYAERYNEDRVDKYDLWQESLDEDAIERLNEIVERTGGLVVISSTWRMSFDSATLENALMKLGFRGTIIGSTPVLMKSVQAKDGRWIHRGYEIENWLNALGDSVESYVIIDDDNDMLESQQSNFVKTSVEYGLQDKQVERATSILLELI